MYKDFLEHQTAGNRHTKYKYAVSDAGTSARRHRPSHHLGMRSKALDTKDVVVRTETHLTYLVCGNDSVAAEAHRGRFLEGKRAKPAQDDNP